MKRWLLRRTPTWILSRWFVLCSLFEKNGIGAFGAAALIAVPGKFLSPTNRERKTRIMSAAARRQLISLPGGGVEILGHPFYALWDNYWGVVFSFFEIIEDDQYRARKFLKEDSVVIDAGGSAGLFAVLAATLAPRGKVYVFEPNHVSFKVLLRNTAPYPNIVCFPFGLGNEPKKSMMRSTDHGHGNAAVIDSPFLEGKGQFGGEMEIDITTIDDFAKEHQLARLDFLKMDTEGYERFVLQRGAETIRKLKPAIGMSAYHNPDDKDVLPKLVESMDPDYIVELHMETGEEIFSCYVPEVLEKASVS